jgi:hypothetical protein
MRKHGIVLLAAGLLTTALAPVAGAMDAPGPAPAAARDQTREYAESAMLAAISMDGREELALRIARDPDSGTGTIWMHLAIDGVVYSTVEEDVPLPMDTTRLSMDTPWSELALDGVRFTRDTATGFRQDAAPISVEAELRASPRRHPEAGDGFHPVTLSLSFRPDGRSFRVHGGTRREAYGEVRGTVTTPERTQGLTLPAKWHEQWGPRGRFAPSFTYLNLQNDANALLAIRYAQGAVGYLMDAAGEHRVTALEIDPEGPATRRFRMTVEGRPDVTGTVRVTQRWSGPVEGRRRTGAGGVAETSLGALAGSLNDWEAPAPTSPRDPDPGP